MFLSLIGTSSPIFPRVFNRLRRLSSSIIRSSLRWKKSLIPRSCESDCFISSSGRAIQSRITLGSPRLTFRIQEILLIRFMISILANLQLRYHRRCLRITSRERASGQEGKLISLVLLRFFILQSCHWHPSKSSLRYAFSLTSFVFMSLLCSLLTSVELYELGGPRP